MLSVPNVNTRHLQHSTALFIHYHSEREHKFEPICSVKHNFAIAKRITALYSVRYYKLTLALHQQLTSFYTAWQLMPTRTNPGQAERTYFLSRTMWVSWRQITMQHVNVYRPDEWGDLRRWSCCIHHWLSRSRCQTPSIYDSTRPTAPIPATRKRSIREYIPHTDTDADTRTHAHTHKQTDTDLIQRQQHKHHPLATGHHQQHRLLQSNIQHSENIQQWINITRILNEQTMTKPTDSDYLNIIILFNTQTMDLNESWNLH